MLVGIEMIRGFTLLVLRRYAYNIPIYAVWVVGIVIAVRNRQRHPRASTLAVIAFSVLLGTSLVAIPVELWVLMVKIARDRFVSADIFYLVQGFIHSLISGGMWVLILFALFSRRRENDSAVQEVGDAERR